ncbi:uncharacterized protein TNIN_369631 [Trichonephila inaurata madagascariensis]|uniref:Uncharacterized protein n=1 Tax=Trichonephila inaurata madagascariensis TaxID=2747483 RepID=A0A8X7CR73_9ARAC|nr:uncharacterized protein TNIN_369631 [Trichonephila inaurata madagascariensis]
MDRDSAYSITFVNSALLTLTKIRDSPNEMVYITKMRNLILFQIPEADYSYLDYKFHHRFRLDKRKTLLYHMCLHYAFSKVFKYPALVHNFEPFRHWRVGTINNTDYLRTQNRNGEELEKEETENVDYFLVANATLYKTGFVEDWTDSDWCIVVAEMVNIVETCLF